MSIREDLKAYLDGELPPDRMAEVRAAIDSDPSLRQEAEYMRALGGEIRRLSAEPEIVGMEKVLGAVTGRGRRNLRLPQNWSWLGAVAAAFFVVVVLAALFPVFGRAKNASTAATTKSALAVREPQDADRGLAPMRDGAVGSAKEAGKALSLSKSEANVGAFRTARSSAPQPAASAPSAGPYASKSALLPADAPSLGFDGALGGPKATVVIASISIEATDVGQAEAEVKRAAAVAGGYAEPGTPLENAGARSDAAKRVALFVPAPKLAAALQDIKAVGHVLVQRFSRMDVGVERRIVADRLAALRRRAGRAAGATAFSLGPKDREKADAQAVGGPGVEAEIDSLTLRQRSLAGDNPMPVIIATIEAVTPGMPPPQRYVAPHPKPKSRLPLVVVFGALGALVLGGIGAFLLFRAHRSPRAL